MSKHSNRSDQLTGRERQSARQASAHSPVRSWARGRLMKIKGYAGMQVIFPDDVDKHGALERAQIAQAHGFLIAGSSDQGKCTSDGVFNLISHGHHFYGITVDMDRRIRITGDGEEITVKEAMEQTRLPRIMGLVPVVHEDAGDKVRASFVNAAHEQRASQDHSRHGGHRD